MTLALVNLPVCLGCDTIFCFDDASAARPLARVLDFRHNLLALASDELDVRVPRLLAPVEGFLRLALVLPRAFNLGVEAVEFRT